MSNNKHSTDDVTIDRFVPITELKRILGVRSNATVYRWVAKGLLPKQKKIGIRRVAWLASEIRQVIATREAA